MLLANVDNKIESSGVATSKSFGIETNAKAFKALSDNLYSNKIGSLVREICSNAKDSHTEAGYPERPFTVHLPCSLEPWFSVQDTGVGMSQEQIFKVFAIYFSSTKDFSNCSIGGYGIGAKTPFVYTDSFTIESVFNGKLGTYTAYLGKDGSPQISLFQEIPTDQPNGVTVKVPTLRSADHDSFRQELKSQLRFFEPKPTVINGGTFKFETLDFKPGFESCGVRLLEAKSLRSLWAVSGGVPYPIDLHLLTVNGAINYYAELVRAFNQNIILDFPIGSLDLALSRESLSYTAKTSNAIVLKLEALGSELKNWITSSLSQLPTKWEQAIFIAENSRLTKLVGLGANYLRSSAATGKLTGGYSHSYLLDLQDAVTTVDAQTVNTSTNRIFTKTGAARKEASTTSFYVTASKQEYFIYNDFPVHFRARIKDWESSILSAPGHFFSRFNYIEPIDRTLTTAETDAVIKKISLSMGAVPIVKASDLPYVKPKASTKTKTKTKTKTATVKYYCLKTSRSSPTDVSFRPGNWDVGYDDLNTNTTGGYYISVKGRSLGKPEDLDYPLLTYGLKLEAYKLLDRPVYAVKQETLNQIQDNPLWVSLIDHSRQFFTTLLNDPVCQKVWVKDEIQQYVTYSYLRSLEELLRNNKWPENSLLGHLASLALELSNTVLPATNKTPFSLIREAFRELPGKLGLSLDSEALRKAWHYPTLFEDHYYLIAKVLKSANYTDTRLIEEATDYLLQHPK
jgi:hypothetical protein